MDKDNLSPGFETSSGRALRERRHSRRHRLRHGALVIDPRILGPVIDLSLDGMLFEYAGGTVAERLPETLGIFVSGPGILVTGLKITPVRDQVTGHSPFLPLIHQTRAVAFHDLTREQERLLRQIIASHSSSPAP